MTVLRTPADRTDQFWPENVSKSEFLIVLRHPKVKIPETFGATLSQNSRSLTEILKNWFKSSLESKKYVPNSTLTFLVTLGDSDCFAQESHQDFSKRFKKCSFSSNFSTCYGFRTERLFCDWNLEGLPKSLQNCSKPPPFDGSWPDLPNPCPFCDWIPSDSQKVPKNPPKLSKMSLFDHFLTLTLEKPLIGDLSGTLLAPKVGFRGKMALWGPPPYPRPHFRPWVPPAGISLWVPPAGISLWVPPAGISLWSTFRSGLSPGVLRWSDFRSRSLPHRNRKMPRVAGFLDFSSRVRVLP